MVNSAMLIKSILLTKCFPLYTYYQLLESEKLNIMMTSFRVFTIPQLHPSILVHREIQHTGYLLTGQFLIHDNAAFGANQWRSRCLVKCRYLNQLVLKEIQQQQNKTLRNFCIPLHIQEQFSSENQEQLESTTIPLQTNTTTRKTK